MNKVAAFALRRKNSILSMSEKMLCPPQPLRFWITPAYAGKRRSDWIIRSIYWDHPRVCGEKTDGAKAEQMTPGSPPRVRGKVYTSTLHSGQKGITPARAGKRCERQGRVSTGRDHPRACGEKVHKVACLHVIQGSPPRMRGKAGSSCRPLSSSRITPAHAGKRTT